MKPINVKLSSYIDFNVENNHRDEVGKLYFKCQGYFYPDVQIKNISLHKKNYDPKPDLSTMNKI